MKPARSSRQHRSWRTPLGSSRGLRGGLHALLIHSLFAKIHIWRPHNLQHPCRSYVQPQSRRVMALVASSRQTKKFRWFASEASSSEGDASRNAGSQPDEEVISIDSSSSEDQLLRTSAEDEIITAPSGSHPGDAMQANSMAATTSRRVLAWGANSFWIRKLFFCLPRKPIAPRRIQEPGLKTR